MMREMCQSTQNLMGKRKQWIDSLRGLAMVWVVVGHQIPEADSFFVLTSAIKIPLFFIISGYLFNDKKKGSEFWSNLLLRMIVPWTVLTLLPVKILYAMLQGSWSKVGDLIISFISGEMAWYMNCCIIAEIIQYYIRKLLKTKFLINIAMICIGVMGYVIGRCHILHFSRIDVACLVQLFFLLGYNIKEYEQRIQNKLCIICMSGAYAALAAILFVYFPGQSIDVNTMVYPSFILSILMIAVGNVALFGIFAHWNIHSKVLAFVGQNTLVYYMLHGTIISVFRKIISRFEFLSGKNMIGIMINVLVAMLGCAVISLVMNCYFPWMTGRRKKQV